jgi:hypothetical protein
MPFTLVERVCSLVCCKRRLRALTRRRLSTFAIQLWARSIPSRIPNPKSEGFSCHTWFLLVSLLSVIGIIGCVRGNGQGSGEPGYSSFTVALTPASVTVTAGSTVSFTATPSSTAPSGGYATWSVDPPYGGSISSSGIFAAAGNAGTYKVVANWSYPPSTSQKYPNTSPTASNPAIVTVLPPPQINAVLQPGLTQAAGAMQGGGLTQNGAIVGQPVPSMMSTDSFGTTQLRSSFTPPLPCAPPGVTPPAGIKPCG